MHRWENRTGRPAEAPLDVRRGIEVPEDGRVGNLETFHGLWSNREEVTQGLVATEGANLWPPLAADEEGMATPVPVRRNAAAATQRGVPVRWCGGVGPCFLGMQEAKKRPGFDARRIDGPDHAGCESAECPGGGRELVLECVDRIESDLHGAGSAGLRLGVAHDRSHDGPRVEAFDLPRESASCFLVGDHDECVRQVVRCGTRNRVVRVRCAACSLDGLRQAAHRGSASKIEERFRKPHPAAVAGGQHDPCELHRRRWYQRIRCYCDRTDWYRYRGRPTGRIRRAMVKGSGELTDLSRSTTRQSRHGEIGRSLPRLDGRAKVDGTALYVDDLSIPGAWHGATVRSPHPSARILSIDATAARAADPEIQVLTGRDLTGPNVVRLIADDWPILATGRTCHIGEAVALVAAPTRQRALQAASLIEVAYEPTPAVLTLDQALNRFPDGRAEPGVAGGSGELARCAIDHGDVDAAWAQADVIVQGTYETGLQEHIYIEPQGMVAIPRADGTMELVGSMQCPYYVQKSLAYLLEMEPSAVRVRQAETGGGFGGKEDYPDMIGAHAALLARAIGRPVKIVYDRHEDIVATTKRHPSRIRHRTGVRADGCLIAAEIEVVLDGGAYTTLSPVVLSRAVIHAAGPYRCPNVRIRGRVLATNTVPNGAFRGFGAPQAQFAAERQMDRIARRLQLDPLTLRERNAYRVGDVTPTGQVLRESVSALECLETAARRTRFRERWAAMEAARAERAMRATRARDERWQPGLGLSLVWHGAGFTGSGEEKMKSPATLRLNEAGRIEVRVAATDFGQGTNQVLAQIVADGAGVRLSDVQVVPPDTAEVPDSGPTVASRTVMVVGGILTRAARRLADEVLVYADEQGGRDSGGGLSLQDGVLATADRTVRRSFEDVARAFVSQHGPREVTEWFESPGGATFDESTYRGEAYAAFGWGCDVVELAVDVDTFEVRLDRVTMVCDVGRAIHPMMCTGQVEGGTLQALGHAYMEELKVADGRFVNDRLQTYIIPTAKDTPDMDVVLLENPSSAGPGGAKGVGELPMDGGAAAVCSAIENATGLSASKVPATPERLWRLAREAESS